MPDTIRVLVVDDNENDFLIVEDMLGEIEPQKYHVTWTGTFEGGLKALATGDYDVCLLDYRLGSHTGLDLLTEMVNQHGVPAIVLTGLEDHEADVAATESGAADYLVKDHLNVPLLERAIRYAIGSARANKALRNSERRHRALIQQSSEGILLVDAEHRIQFASPSADRLLGFATGELTGKSIFTLFAHSGIDRESDPLLMALTTTGPGQTTLVRHRLEHSQGHFPWLESSVTNQIQDQNIGAYVVNTRDITERVESEQALLEAQRLAQSTVDALMANICVLDEKGTIVTVNAAWQDFALRNGMTDPSGGVGTNYLAVCDGSSTTESRAVGQGIRDVIAGLSEAFYLEYPCGRPEKAEWFAVRVTRFAAASPLRVVVAHEHITERRRVQTALKRSELEQRQLASQLAIERSRLLHAQAVSKVGSWETNVKTLEVLWSDETHRIHGTDSATFHPTHDKFLQLVHPDDREMVNGAFVASLRVATAQKIEHRLLLGDGQVRFVEERWQTSFNEAGEPIRVVGTCQDITARKEIEQQLRQAHDNLEDRVQLRTAELAEANEVLAIEIRERQLAEGLARARARQHEAVADLGRAALTIADVHELLIGATALVSATLDVEDCAIFQVQPKGHGLLLCAAHGFAGMIPGIDTISSDSGSLAEYAFDGNAPVISRRFAGENRFVPEASMVDCGVLDIATVTIGTPPDAFGLLVVGHRNPGEIDQSKVNFLVAIAHVLDMAIAHQVVLAEVRQLNQDLHSVNESLRVEAVERQIAMGALKQAANDLQLAKQEADSANTAKSEFLSRMSHELRTPLNAILGFGQLLSYKDLGQAANEDVTSILKAGRHLLELINEVLEISRIEAGVLSLSPEPVHAEQLIDEALGMVAPLAEHRGIITRRETEVPELSLRADRQRLRQVLLNLLGNAIKYNRDGGNVVVTLEKSPASADLGTGTLPQKFFRIEVRDTGYGLSPAELAKLFTPFERLGAAQTMIEGTGIGLVLAKQLVELMGGRIGVESIIGQGSTFWIDLPVASENHILPDTEKGSSLLIRPEAAFLQSSASRRYTLLCIEDNPSNLELVRTVMDMHPHVDVIGAPTGQRGLELAAEKRPDLILLDVHLPDIDGQQVLTRLRAQPNICDIPVVVLSADATVRQIERLLAAGAVDYLTKPLDIPAFVKVVLGLLQQAPP